MASSQLVKKVLRAAARFKQVFAACGENHKNPRHVRGFLYKPTASAPIRAHADAGILDRKRGFDRRLLEKRSFSSSLRWEDFGPPIFNNAAMTVPAKYARMGTYEMASKGGMQYANHWN